MMRAAALAFALCLFPAIGLAEEAGAQCGPGEDCTEYFMDGESVTGDLQRPDQGMIRSQRGLNRPPLIRTRVHFVNEMVKSVEDI